MLKYFTVTNFRNLNLNSIKFQSINLFVGPNNSGKSNLIDAISFFSNLILSERKESALLDELSKRGWDDLLNKKIEKPGTIDLKWVIETGENYPDLCYELQFLISSSDYISKGFYITNEQLRNAKPMPGRQKSFEFVQCHGSTPGTGFFSVRGRNSKEPKRLALDVSQYDTVFNQMKSLLESSDFRINFYPNFNQTVQIVQDFFQQFHAYSSTNFNLSFIREPVEIETNSRYLSKSGSNFVNVLSYLDEKYDFLDIYQKILNDLLPGLERVKIVFSGERKRGLRLVINGETFKLSEMSDGTIKAMLIALLLWSPEKMTMLALDEPELNLHPSWLKVISRWAQRSTSAKQFFISTHSPDFLDGFTEMFSNGKAELFSFNFHKEQMIKKVSVELLEESIKAGWELGDLYRVGDPALGGWPW